METIPAHNRFIRQKTSDKITRLLTAASPVVMDVCLLILRGLTGILLFVVGSGKLFGWFGGYGLQPSLLFYAKMGFAPWLAYVSIFTESFGGLLLATGLLTRPVTIAVMINMLVATVVTLPNGFMGPSGASYPFMFLVNTVIIFLAGPGAYSLDALIIKKKGGPIHE